MLQLIMSFAVLLLCIIPSTAFGRQYEGTGPLVTRNQNPVYLQTLSLMPRRAESLPEGVLETRVESAYSSIFERAQNSRVDVNLDMEFWRLAVMANYGLDHGLEVGLEIPFVHFSGGFLDGFINAFHEFFGFPSGGREHAANDDFHYRFDADEATRLNFPPATWGLGDIAIRVKGQITGENDDWPAIAWFADLKFPTGRRSRGFGNGALDFGLGAAMDLSWKRLHGYFNVGYYVTGGNEYLDGYMHNEMLAYMLAGEIALLNNLSVIAQIQGGTPLLTGTGIDTWDGIPLDLIIGFKGDQRNLFGPGSDLIWQLGFAEDVTSRGPSVDFTVYMSLGVRFDTFERRRPVGDWIAAKKTEIQNPKSQIPDKLQIPMTQ